MTGLSTDTAEELQVVNYGIGGHYEPHFDFARVRHLLYLIYLLLYIYHIKLFREMNLMHSRVWELATELQLFFFI